ncbi:hypothetical protein NUW58_g830 [Xylaria curta]|uniref:Uncharacterized protein n=1 Tax=Xylaria curta TaxID=42375 RepID=A0ACC1PMX2_9PEZI|nr:hypothetical protein NUW58_g830 [Xylaria curta]
MPPGTNSNEPDEVHALSQAIAGLLTAQSSCAIHEQCDSSCPGRIGARRYRLMPDGTRRDEVDQRAQWAATNAGAKVSVRTEPLVIVAPVYGALSYCWGQPPDDIKFLCNNKVFYGRASLERALKRLRAGFKPGQREEYIWADAICINQKDLVEKDAQVRLMERIYSGAATVYVDLGDIEGQDIPVGNYNLRFSAFGGMGAQDELTESDQLGHPFHYMMAFQSLSQPWFTRTWIIQELALARTVKYMFRGNVFTQAHLDSILSKPAMVANPSYQQELMRSNITMRGYMNYQKLQSIKNHNGKMDSLQLIQLTRDFAVTNPEDKIFGLFALMSDADREAIGPYSRSIEQVYRRFAALQVRRGRTITMLDSAGLQRRSQQGVSLPSWVPDWTAQGKSPKVISTLRPVPYSASGAAQANVQLVSDITGTGGISVRCLMLDTIDTVAHVHTAPLTRTGQPDFLVFHDKFRAAFDELVRRGKSVYVNNEEAFARLLLMDDMYTGRNAIIYSSPIVDPAATYRAALVAWRDRRDEGNIGGKKMDTMQTYQMQARAAAVGRGFATTQTGYIGLVPNCAQVGDQVVVILGATVPYVVRKVQSGYLLVGDAFVHGLMYGEALERRDLPPTDVVLV